MTGRRAITVEIGENDKSFYGRGQKYFLLFPLYFFCPCYPSSVVAAVVNTAPLLGGPLSWIRDTTRPVQWPGPWPAWLGRVLFSALSGSKRLIIQSTAYIHPHIIYHISPRKVYDIVGHYCYRRLWSVCTGRSVHSHMYACVYLRRKPLTPPPFMSLPD